MPASSPGCCQCPGQRAGTGRGRQPLGSRWSLAVTITLSVLLLQALLAQLVVEVAWSHATCCWLLALMETRTPAAVQAAYLQALLYVWAVVQQPQAQLQVLPGAAAPLLQAPLSPAPAPPCHQAAPAPLLVLLLVQGPQELLLLLLLLLRCLQEGARALVVLLLQGPVACRRLQQAVACHGAVAAAVAAVVLSQQLLLLLLLLLLLPLLLAGRCKWAVGTAARERRPSLQG